MIGYRWDRADGPGDHQVVVLSGSLGSTLRIWDTQVEPLRQHFDVLRIDHRGHGGSTGMPPPNSLDDLVADLLEVLDHERVPTAHLVGVSLGGMLALATAINQPERVDRVAVMCTAAAFDAPEYWHARADRVLAAGPQAVAQDIVSRWFTPAYAKLHPELVAEMVAMISATQPDGYAGCCRAIGDMDLRPALATVSACTLVIAAEGDATTPPPLLDAIAELVPNSRSERVPGAHLVNVERTELINRLLLDHLTGRPTSTDEESA